MTDSLCPCPEEKINSADDVQIQPNVPRYENTRESILDLLVGTFSDSKYCHQNRPFDLNILVDPTYEQIRDSLHCIAYPEFILKINSSESCIIDIKGSAALGYDMMNGADVSIEFEEN